MIDPAVAARIEASGETVTATHLTFRMTVLLSDRFYGLPGYIGTPSRPRFGAYDASPPDQSCFEGDNVLVRLRVSSDRTGAGYRVTIDATQAQRRYESFIERSVVFTLPPGARHGIPFDAEIFPGRFGPFWDVTRDAHRLSTVFVSDLLEQTASVSLLPRMRG